MDTDLATVDISVPMLADGIYDLQVSKVEIKPTQTPGGEMISLELTTTAPATSRTGQMLHPGVKIFHNVNTKPTGKATWDMVKQGLGGLVQAAAFPPGVASLGNIPVWVNQLQGKILRAKVEYAPAGVNAKNGKAFKEKNLIAYFSKRV